MSFHGLPSAEFCSHSKVRHAGTRDFAGPASSDRMTLKNCTTLTLTERGASNGIGPIIGQLGTLDRGRRHLRVVLRPSIGLWARPEERQDHTGPLHRREAAELDRAERMPHE